MTTKSGYQIIPILSGRSNVCLLSNATTNILIDTGVRRDWKKLHKKLNRLKVNTIDYLILTHTHFDHVGNAKRIKDIYNAQVIVQQNGIDYLAKGDNIVPKGTNMFVKALTDLFAKTVCEKWTYEPCDCDIKVGEYMHLRKLGFNAYLTSTIGHSPDSMCLVIDDEVSIVGDIMFGLFKGTIMSPFGANIQHIIRNWGLLLDTASMIFIPGHGLAIDRLTVQREYNRRLK